MIIAKEIIHVTEYQVVKNLELHGAGISVMEVHGHYIFTGGDEGFVRVFDTSFRLISWFEVSIHTVTHLHASFTNYILFAFYKEKLIET